MRKIAFLDTTLRDGEQTPGVNLHTREKAEIAQALEDMGVDIIEAGFPASSQGDFNAVLAVARGARNIRVAVVVADQSVADAIRNVAAESLPEAASAMKIFADINEAEAWLARPLDQI